ncbi:hypothetical protein C2W64_01188 [Brevibacillus laterosporus]|nr:hypothetical protein C2W64_01188 [Brevibacillus laterosporus]
MFCSQIVHSFIRINWCSTSAAIYCSILRIDNKGFFSTLASFVTIPINSKDIYINYLFWKLVHWLPPFSSVLRDILLN